MGLNQSHFWHPTVWPIVPQEVKKYKSLDSFKKTKGIGNQFAHVGYIKLACHMLVLYNKMC